MNASCTVASAINFEEERVSGNKFVASPSFLYYNTRYLEGKENYDCFRIKYSIFFILLNYTISSFIFPFFFL